jgi:hypothetical protein
MSPNLIQSNDEIVDEDEIDDSTLNIYSHVDIYQLSFNQTDSHSTRFNSSTNTRLTFREYYILFIQGQLRSSEYIEYYNLPRISPSNSPYNHLAVYHARYLPLEQEIEFRQSFQHRRFVLPDDTSVDSSDDETPPPPLESLDYETPPPLQSVEKAIN